MNRIFHLLLGLWLLTSFQNEYLSEAKKLALTCKIWGFLKYHHPNVISGNINWDKALINFLSSTEAITETKRFNEMAFTSINSIGHKPIYKGVKILPESVFEENLNLSWLNDSSEVSGKLLRLLKNVKMNRPHYSDGYYSIQDAVSLNINMKNELVDSNLMMPSEHYRLLELFRFWNVIEYYYPYKYLMDTSWDSTLVAFVPKFIVSTDTLNYRLLLMELVSKLNDTHAFYYSKYAFSNFFGTRILPVQVKLIDHNLVVTNLMVGRFANTPALNYENEFQKGDILLSIDDVRVESLLSKCDKYLPGSNQNARERNIGAFILRSSKDWVSIKLKRDGQIVEINSLVFDYLEDPECVIEPIQKFDSTCIYFDMSKILEDSVDSLMTVAKVYPRIIFDLRNGIISDPVLWSRYFHTESINYCRFLTPSFKFPGTYVWRDELLDLYSTGSVSSTEFVNSELICLVNEYTQSTGETAVMCFQAYEKCRVIGSQTAGANGNVFQYNFLNGSNFTISGIGVYYPDKSCVQRSGTKIDFEVYPSISGVKHSRDEILEFALNFKF